MPACDRNSAHPFRDGELQNTRTVGRQTELLGASRREHRDFSAMGMNSILDAVTVAVVLAPVVRPAGISFPTRPTPAQERIEDGIYLIISWRPFQSPSLCAQVVIQHGRHSVDASLSGLSSRLGVLPLVHEPCTYHSFGR